MSYKSRIVKLESYLTNDQLWAIFGTGTGSLRDENIQRELKEKYHANGGNRNAYIAFFPFEEFGFHGYVRKKDIIELVMNRSKNPAE